MPRNEFLTLRMEDVRPHADGARLLVGLESDLGRHALGSLTVDQAEQLRELLEYFCRHGQPGRYLALELRKDRG